MSSRLDLQSKSNLTNIVNFGRNDARKSNHNIESRFTTGPKKTPHTNQSLPRMRGPGHAIQFTSFNSRHSSHTPCPEKAVLGTNHTCKPRPCLRKPVSGTSNSRKSRPCPKQAAEGTAITSKVQILHFELHFGTTPQGNQTINSLPTQKINTDKQRRHVTHAQTGFQQTGVDDIILPKTLKTRNGTSSIIIHISIT